MIRRLLFLFLCVGHLPHPVFKPKTSLKPRIYNNTCSFCKRVGVLLIISSALSPSLISTSTCSFPAPLILQLLVTNPLAGPPSLGKTHFTYIPWSLVLFYSSSPRTFPQAVTLLGVGVRANHIGFHPKALPPASNSVLRHFPESNVWPKVPLDWCPPVSSLSPCYSFSP